MQNLVIIGICFGFSATALAGPPSWKWLRSVDAELVSIAESARSREISAAEVSAIASDPFATQVFLENSLRRRMGGGKQSAMVHSSKFCVSQALIELHAAFHHTDPKTYSPSGWWKRFRYGAFLAKAFFAEAESLDALGHEYRVKAGSRVGHLEGLAGEFLRLRAAAPTGERARADYWLAQKRTEVSVVAAGLVELGKAGADAAWEVAQADTATMNDLIISHYTLAALRDPRLLRFSYRFKDSSSPQARVYTRMLKQSKAQLEQGLLHAVGTRQALFLRSGGFCPQNHGDR